MLAIGQITKVSRTCKSKQIKKKFTGYNWLANFHLARRELNAALAHFRTSSKSEDQSVILKGHFPENMDVLSN